MIMPIEPLHSGNSGTHKGENTFECKTDPYSGFLQGVLGAVKASVGKSSKCDDNRERQITLPYNPKRLDFEEVYRLFVGRVYTRRRFKVRKTLHVVDCTLGGDIIVRQPGRAREFMHQSMFLDWLGTSVREGRKELVRRLEALSTSGAD